MSNATEQKSNIPQRLSPWIQLFLSIVAFLGVLWTIIQFFNPLKNVDITVLVQKEIPINWSQVVGSSTSLELVYDGVSINNATIIQINILNTGSVPIGKKGVWEEIILKSDNNARIALLSPPVTLPSNLEFQVNSKLLTNTLDLQVGLFNPGDSIELNLIVVEPQDINHPTLFAETRISNLSKVITIRGSIEDRLTDAFSGPVAVFTLLITLLIFIALFKDFRQGDWGNRYKMFLGLIGLCAGLQYGVLKLIIWLVTHNK